MPCGGRLRGERGLRVRDRRIPAKRRLDVGGRVDSRTRLMPQTIVFDREVCDCWIGASDEGYRRWEPRPATMIAARKMPPRRRHVRGPDTEVSAPCRT